MGQMRKLEGISIQLMIDHASELENYQTQEDGLMGQMRKLEGISIQLMIDHASELENYQTQEGNLREELLNVQLKNKSLRQRIYDIEQNDKGERESQTEFINAMTEKIEHLKLKQVKLTTTIAELVNQLR